MHANVGRYGPPISGPNFHKYKCGNAVCSDFDDAHEHRKISPTYIYTCDYIYTHTFS